MSKETVIHLKIGEEATGQRLDNFLVRVLKGVPRSHVYRVIRQGEVRVNGKRVDADRRLEAGDEVRVPPVRRADPGARPAPGGPDLLPGALLYRDDAVLVIAKPGGMAVHGGSGVSFGVIEKLRQELPDARFLELVHRIDRDTSGVLVLALRRPALTALHKAFRERQVEKRYLCLVKGRFRNALQHVRVPLHKFTTGEGERRVRVDEAAGREAHTVFRLVSRFEDYSLVEAEILTGRTHQIRVHLAHLKHPIAGDDKYGDFALNRTLKKQGLKRMFLHAAHLGFAHPISAQPMSFDAPLADDLAEFLATLTSDATAI